MVYMLPGEYNMVPGEYKLVPEEYKLVPGEYNLGLGENKKCSGKAEMISGRYCCCLGNINIFRVEFPGEREFYLVCMLLIFREASVNTQS